MGALLFDKGCIASRVQQHHLKLDSLVNDVPEHELAEGAIEAMTLVAATAAKLVIAVPRLRRDQIISKGRIIHGDGVRFNLDTATMGPGASSEFFERASFLRSSRGKYRRGGGSTGEAKPREDGRVMVSCAIDVPFSGLFDVFGDRVGVDDRPVELEATSVHVRSDHLRITHERENADPVAFRRAFDEDLERIESKLRELEAAVAPFHQELPSLVRARLDNRRRLLCDEDWNTMLG